MTLDGLLLVDKPKGWTSHDVVAAVRGRLPKKTKVGHSGTLDPQATGLLVLLIGAATKCAALFQGCGKTYSGTIRFGVATDTADLDGKVIAEAPVPSFTPERLQAVFDSLLGARDLPPPAYSAVKVHGRPLYDYARRGIAVEAKPRPQRVDSWNLLEWASPEASFRMRCSGGTYVRCFAVAAGEKLGCPAALSSLRREEVGPYTVAGAIGAEEAKKLMSEQIAELLLAPEVPQAR